MTAAAKGSYAAPMIITQSEATAAQRTFLFHLVLTADQANATGLVPVMTLSKAGAAFAAAAGAVTELANGWYKAVLTAVDVDTIGQLGVNIAVALADTLCVVHQVTAFDLNTATVTPAADSITAAVLAASAGTELQSGVATAAAVAALSAGVLNTAYAMGTRTTDGDFAGKASMKDAIQTIITVTGVWNGATVTAYVTEDPTATVVAWTALGTPLTANGTIVLPGPHTAFKATVSNDGAATDLTAVAHIQKANYAV